MITATPTAYEIHDDGAKELLAKITMFDEGGSGVEITTIVNAESWIELATVIRDALKKMHPKKEGL